MRYWYAIIAILIVAIIFVAKPQAREDPLAELRTASGIIDQACCSDATVQLSLPAGTRMYATEEAVCLRMNASIFCAKCMCDVLPAEIMNTTERQTASCSFTNDGQARVHCS
jgi:hypothetical protein